MNSLRYRAKLSKSRYYIRNPLVRIDMAYGDDQDSMVVDTQVASR